MTDKKFTDEEIIKALECMSGKVCQCAGCRYESSDLCYQNCSDELAKDVLSLINRQKAEIERIRQEAFAHQQALSLAIDKIDKAKAEAIKEFAERLKEKIHTSVRAYWNNYSNGYYLAEDVDDDIDQIAKELTEGET